MVRLPNELWIAIFRINARLDAELNYFLGRLRFKKGPLAIWHSGTDMERQERYYFGNNGRHTWTVTVPIRMEPRFCRNQAIEETEIETGGVLKRYYAFGYETDWAYPE